MYMYPYRLLDDIGVYVDPLQIEQSTVYSLQIDVVDIVSQISTNQPANENYTNYM